MSEYRGYFGKSLEFLKQFNVIVGDDVDINAEINYQGTIMPRYEHTDDKHIALKLKNGYNIGIEIKTIKEIKKINIQEKVKEDMVAPSFEEGLPKILLLSTGGTIASKIDYRTGAVTPIISAQELHSSVPELSKIANIETEVLFAEYSENIVPEHWIQIAKRISTINQSDYDGVIIAHGTDTMHYTSAFLSFALNGFSIPIVLVGSQRSSDRASSDAALNLIGATRLIVEKKPNGVYIVMHENENDNTIACHLGTRVRKNHTSKRGAFQTIGDKPAFIITENEISSNNKEILNNQFEPKINLEKKIALVKYYPGFDTEILEKIIEMNFQGIIFEGTGLGHIGKTMYESVKKASEKQMFLGMTSQCIDGRVSMTVYESGRDLLNLGIIPLKNMLPEVALVKAMWAKANSKDLEGRKEIMLKNFAHELTE
jgi:glutamyl-tRNA(Gln) amidotransferase subunit D